MVAQTAKEAKDNARRYTRCTPGMCGMYTRTWLEIPSREPSAAAMWHAAKHKHIGDRTPPAGAPVFWLGGSQGFGHIGLSMGNGMFRGTDMPSSGLVSTQRLSWVDDNWGASQDYAGWAEDLNGILIPYLSNGGATQWSRGPVYLSKLHHGQENSDSVRRLQWRLSNHDDLKAAPVPTTGNWGPQTTELVKRWQRKFAASGPMDGTEMSLTQARRLFGDKFSVRAHD